MNKVKTFYKLTYYNTTKDGYKYVKLYKTLKECNNVINNLRKSGNGYYGFKITPIKFQKEVKENV